jgi:hypothetical protein
MQKTDLIREVEKIHDALIAADRHFMAEAQMNAALHLSTDVRPSPLAAKIAVARESAAVLVSRLDTEVMT